MQERDQSRLASVITLLLGIWIVISPIWLNMSEVALTSTLITGVVIGILGIAQFFSETVVPSWIMGMAAVWLFISAFALGFSDAAIWTIAITAIVTFLVSLWDGVEIGTVTQHHHAHVQ